MINGSVAVPKWIAPDVKNSADGLWLGHGDVINRTAGRILAIECPLRTMKYLSIRSMSKICAVANEPSAQ